MKGGNTVPQIFQSHFDTMHRASRADESGGQRFCDRSGERLSQDSQGRSDTRVDAGSIQGKTRLNSILSKSQIKGTVRCVALKHIVEESGGNT